jgi:hypothetical protein
LDVSVVETLPKLGHFGCQLVASCRIRKPPSSKGKA